MNDIEKNKKSIENKENQNKNTKKKFELSIDEILTKILESRK